MHKVDADKIRRNTSHVSRVGAYPLQIARAGLVGVVFCNARPYGPADCALQWGLDGKLSTNPIAFAAGRLGRLQGLLSELYRGNLERSPQRPRVHSSRIGPNVGEILLPGDPEYRSAEERKQPGTPIDDTTWGRIQQAGIDLRLDAHA